VYFYKVKSKKEFDLITVINNGFHRNIWEILRLYHSLVLFGYITISLIASYFTVIYHIKQRKVYNVNLRVNLRLYVCFQLWTFFRFSFSYFLTVFNDGTAKILVSLTGTIKVLFNGKLDNEDKWTSFPVVLQSKNML